MAKECNLALIGHKYKAIFQSRALLGSVLLGESLLGKSTQVLLHFLLLHSLFIISNCKQGDLYYDPEASSEAYLVKKFTLRSI